MSHSKKVLLSFAVILACLAGACAWADERELVVYSARNEHLIKPLFDAYTDKTGVRIRFITDKEGPLLERLKAEGESSPADLLMTVDAGNLWHAAQEGVLRPVKSEVLEKSVPEAYRDPEGRWFGLSLRARTIVYNNRRVKPAELSTLEALGNPEWKGRLCLRTSKKVYNQSLVAMLIGLYGEARTEEIVRSWVANLAAEPFANDDAVLSAVAAGQCDAGIVNTYYYGRMIEKTPDLPLSLFWTDKDSDHGVHVNISGAGITRFAPHPEEALKFVEWLVSPEAQNKFADANLEYPVNPSVSPHPDVQAWGSFKADSLPVAKAGEFQARAVKLMDRVGYK